MPRHLNLNNLSAQIRMCSQLSSHLKFSWSCWRFIHSTLPAPRKRMEDFRPVEDLYTNPIDRLQPMVQIPIIPENDTCFKPTRGEMEKASMMFEVQNKKQKFKFVGSYPNPHIMPKWETPEVAFIGKSNVGKSSLLAAMFAQIPDVEVRTSKKPGHTKLMNVFNVDDQFHLVDMPGYGYNMPDHFDTSVEAYLKSRRNVMSFILFDASYGMTKNDQKYFKRYSELNLPLCMVLTKIDLAKPSTLIRSVMSVLKFRNETRADSCFPQPFLVSSMNGEGLAHLQSFIAYICGNLKIESLS